MINLDVKKFDVLAERERLHGIVGKESNRARKEGRKFFRAFVRPNRAPTGRKPDNIGLHHGAVFHVDARWEALEASKIDKRRSFCTDVVQAGKSAFGRSGAGRTVCEWFQVDFGIRVFVDGTNKPSPEHTMLFLHKMDACSTCGVVRAGIQSTKQCLSWKRQQGDGTIPRLEAMRELVVVATDLEDVLKTHIFEESKVTTYHKHSSRMLRLSTRVSLITFRDFWPHHLLKGATTSLLSQSKNLNRGLIYLRVINKISWCPLGSERRSLDLRSTFLVIGITSTFWSFILMGPRMSTTTFQTSSTFGKFVSCAKYSDDTLSTLAEALLGRTVWARPEPPLYRPGYDKGGNVCRLFSALKLLTLPSSIRNAAQLQRKKTLT